VLVSASISVVRLGKGIALSLMCRGGFKNADARNGVPVKSIVLTVDASKTGCDILVANIMVFVTLNTLH